MAMRKLIEEEMTLGELVAFKQLATEIEHFAKELKIPAGDWTAIIAYATWAIDNIRLANPRAQDKNEQKIHDEKVKRQEAEKGEANRAIEAKLSEERKNSAFASLPADVQDTIQFFAETTRVPAKVSRAQLLLQQLEEKKLDINKCAGVLAEIGSSATLNLLGCLAALLPPESGRALYLAMPREMIGRLEDKSTATGFAFTWWQMKAAPDGSTKTEDIVQEFCDFFEPLKEQGTLATFATYRYQMKERAIAMFKQRYEYTDQDRAVEQLLARL